MDTDDVKPGFTQLRLEYSRDQYILEFCEEHNGKHYCSSALWKGNILLHGGDKGKTIHGPCITDKTGDFDFAFSLHCETWISSAVNWITRSSRSWPSHNVTQSIINHGVLFVPIGVHGSPKEDLEWRVSFSVAEKLLINTFTHTQLMCYALLKIILKDVIANDDECKDLLCSYFLKTIIFWISEELPSSVWKPDNLIPCFMRCFSRLVYCVEHSVCLHYFIPENNMFENKIEGRARDVLLKKLNTLHSYGWQSILFSDQISNFDVAMWNFPIEPFTLYVNDVEKIVQSSNLYIANCSLESYSELDIFNTGLLQNIWCHHSSLKQIYAYYISQRCSILAQRLPFAGATINNKNQYKQYKSCLSTLLTNVYHDAVSGWLMVASFFYKTKQYRKALHIIRYSLSKCTSDKLFFGMTLSDNYYQLLKLLSFNNKSVVYLLKIMFVDCIRFNENSALTPDELVMEGCNNEYYIPSTAYAYFLSVLCHYHLNDVRHCQDSIQDLKIVIGERYLMSHVRITAEAYTLLGIALQLFGDKESARQAFLQSLEIYTDESNNSAAMRLL
ncbi:cyclic GMP-AMP synthase-like receptor 2 [Mytilus galloprovincialis]|uniref:cyclic GMP-AMP synthase-like receptor 2 n=1 Tax=Mytilus galloprovincialis TaxID=29158 RepID=UPI003F7CC5AE